MLSKSDLVALAVAKKGLFVQIGAFFLERERENENASLFIEMNEER